MGFKIRLSEKEFEKARKKSEKISLSEIFSSPPVDSPSTKKKPTGIDVKKAIARNEASIVSYSHSDNHLAVLFDGAGLLSVNQIFAILEFRKYEIFKYKKSWHWLVKKALDSISAEKGGNMIPFDGSVDLILYVRAPRLVDEDAMTTMFKYVIDGMKVDKEKNPNGILLDDNQNFVHKIECHSEKGSHAIGIRINRSVKKKPRFSVQDLLG